MAVHDTSGVRGTTVPRGPADLKLPGLWPAADPDLISLDNGVEEFPHQEAFENQKTCYENSCPIQGQVTRRRAFVEVSRTFH